LAVGQVFLSWFGQAYAYRVEEGDPRYGPSKIEAVRKDGEDFDDVCLDYLKRRLEATIFPRSLYILSLEVDEFRRFVRIYVDSTLNERPTKGKSETGLRRLIVPKDEIVTKINNGK